jgi:hypothetical protein
MLPDVVQQRNAPLGGHPADRIQQGVVGPAARRQLDADHPGIEATVELSQRVTLEIGIDHGVPTNSGLMGTLKVQEERVAVLDVFGGREVNG